MMKSLAIEQKIATLRGGEGLIKATIGSKKKKAKKQTSKNRVLLKTFQSKISKYKKSKIFISVRHF